MAKRILIVDDNSTNIYLLEALLKGHNLAVTTANNGQEALEKARLDPPDLVVTDILMPVMDGYALCREWKADERLRHIPLIFYTATYTEPKDEAFALSLGADLFLIKPQEPEVMMDVINRMSAEDYVPRSAAARPLGEDMEFFRQHNEALFGKLEKKMMDLEGANRKLTMMEERYRLSFENIMDVVYMIDSELNVLDMSPSVERILGYKPEEFIGRSVASMGYIFMPESFEQAVTDTGRILKGETIPATIYYFVARDGTLKIGEVSGSPVRREGQIIGMISVARDVTAHKRTEEALRESEERYRNVFENHTAVKFIIDSDSGRIVEANKAAVKYYGWPHERLREMNIQDINTLPTEDIQKEMKKALAKEKTYFEFRHRRADGSIRDVEVYSSTVDLKGKKFLHSIVHDITERKTAEEALRESEEVFRLLFEKSTDGHLLMEGDRYIDCNEAALRIAGFADKAMLINRTPAEISPERQPDGELSSVKAKRMIEIAIREGTHCFEWVRRQADGSERYLDVTLTLIPMKGRKLLHITWRDMTEHVRSRNERERLQSQLIQSQKMEAVGNLAGGIAHDFNNILTGIMGYTEFYMDEVRDRPKIYRGMEQVLKAADRAKDLVRQILTFSRKTEQEKKPVNFSQIVDEVVRFMRASLPTTIEINLQVGARSDVILGDPSQLHQVLVNLCTNAGHAMKDKGGILDVELERIAVDADDLLQIPPIKRGLYLLLNVRDTGHGISRANLERIFEPYFTTKEKGEGTGLGLAVVHGIVKDHGGEIRVYSEEGRGTNFKVYLPLLEHRTEDRLDEAEALPRGEGETILFIDDERMLVDLNRNILENLGYRVVTETDPIKAIETFKEGCGTFDLVITDKTMPHLTGFDVARAVRDIRVDIPILLCSGFQEKGDMERLADIGMSGMIVKPAKRSILANAIRNLLDENRHDRDRNLH